METGNQTSKVNVAPQRRPWVDSKTLARLVHMSPSAIQKYNQLPNCPVIRITRKTLRYDVDKYRQWLENDGPKKGRALLAAQVRESHQ